MNGAGAPPLCKASINALEGCRAPGITRGTSGTKDRLKNRLRGAPQLGKTQIAPRRYAPRVWICFVPRLPLHSACRGCSRTCWRFFWQGVVIQRLKRMFWVAIALVLTAVSSFKSRHVHDAGFSNHFAVVGTFTSMTESRVQRPR